MVLARGNVATRRRLILFFVALVFALAAVGRQLLSSASAPFAAIPRTNNGYGSAAEQGVAYWQNSLQAEPDDARAYAQLGLAYLQQVRETGDATLYTLAEEAFDEALAREETSQRDVSSAAHSLDALIGHGILALARHDFTGALAWGERAREINPYRAQVLGILVDANVELGRYDEAVTMAQAMVDLRPDLASYSRVSYVRELHGDVEGAITAMKAAVSAGVPGTEETAWTQVQLGNLYLGKGDLQNAEAVFRQTLYFRPDYPHALAGIGRIQALRGETMVAINTLLPVIERLPLPEFAILLGELYEAAGQPEAAEHQYGLVRVIQELNAGAGMNVDLELALFEADHGDRAHALEMARAAYARRPNIYAADTLAWALYRNKEFAEAWQFSQEALRLGTQDARLHAHASLIAQALGDEAAAAKHQAAALAINHMAGRPGSVTPPLP
jgi:tetratricopeptide (TPR) repeat protein